MGSRRGRILLVEDHEDTLVMAERILRDAGHHVRAARSKAEALTLCGGEQFDVLVGELTLPDGSGLDLMREVAAACGIKGIAFTGWGQREDIDNARAAGFSLHLLKPVSVDVLIRSVQEVLGEIEAG
jgi:CheY-like chemotaxis protein